MLPEETGEMRATLVAGGFQRVLNARCARLGKSDSVLRCYEPVVRSTDRIPGSDLNRRTFTITDFRLAS